MIRNPGINIIETTVVGQTRQPKYNRIGNRRSRRADMRREQVPRLTPISWRSLAVAFKLRRLVCLTSAAIANHHGTGGKCLVNSNRRVVSLARKRIRKIEAGAIKRLAGAGPDTVIIFTDTARKFLFRELAPHPARFFVAHPPLFRDATKLLCVPLFFLFFSFCLL